INSSATIMRNETIKGWPTKSSGPNSQCSRLMVTCAVANGSADYCATTTAKPRKAKASEFMDSTASEYLHSTSSTKLQRTFLPAGRQVVISYHDRCSYVREGADC